jgi:osmotically-inducible protein OsmY
VFVEEGRVVLKGNAPTIATKNAACFDARFVPGVKTMDDQIKVNYIEQILDDQVVSSRVEKVIQWSADLGKSGISSSVYAGIATLEGTVETFWKKEMAGKIVSYIGGVLDIENKIEVGEDKDRVPDDKIKKDILSAIGRSTNLRSRNISIEVENGRVTLTGNVNNSSEYSTAEQVVANTSGVRDMLNDLVIVP